MVEASPSDAERVIDHLTQAGMAVDALCVNHVQDFIQAIGERRWDAILCDDLLPSSSARDVLALVDASPHPIPVILVSSPISEERATLLMQAGARDYLPKSNLDRLVHCVHRVVAETRLRDERARVEAEHVRLGIELRQSDVR